MIADLIGTSEESWNKSKDESQGRVYLFKFVEPTTGDVIYKVGKSSGKSSLDRFISVCRSMYLKYQIMPRAKIKRDRKSSKPFKDEAAIHHLLKEYKYKPSFVFSGSTEFFLCDEETVLNAYHSIFPV